MSRDEQRARIREANREAARQADEVKARLEEEHGLSTHPKRDVLWSKAWELGHAYGLHEVESYYADLSDLLKDEVDQ